MGYKRHFGSLANHEKQFHPLPAIVPLSSSNARLDGASFAFQNSGVESRRGGVATIGSGAAIESSGVNFCRGGASFRFSGVPSRFSGVANCFSGAANRTSGVRFRFSGASLQTSRVPSKTGGFALKRHEFHEFSPIATKRRKILTFAPFVPFRGHPQLPTPNSQIKNYER
jgi:hypothetical protein